ncbi:MAG: hypothetical protein IJ060_03245 [Oscillospiraceae bacterium]|nr:hypothetical protein [Oscillospiraceae bacterium]
MENQIRNPFEDEKPQIVHFEKNESHYEYCRMQMHDIEQTHRRTFIVNFALCIVVCFLAVFRKYVAGFGILSTQYANVQSDNKIAEGGAFLAGGIFQILFGMIIIVLGYLAWANFHSLNIILETWYAVITVYGIIKADYISALVGIVGAVFYFFSLREMRHEQALSEMEGYPEFQEKFDISKSDIVVQTLLAHKGEQRTKSTLFTTDYSLRRKKKKTVFGNEEPEESDKGKELAEVLQKRLDEVKDARQARTAIASLDAVVAEQKREKAAEAEAAAQEAESAEAKQEAEPEAKSAPERDAQAEAEAILAEAEAKAKALLAEAAQRASALTKPAQEQAAPEKQKPAAPAAKKSGNPQKRRKKR